MNLITTVAPIGDPITLAEAKNHLHVDDTNSDIRITGLIAAATLNAEHVLKRALMTRTYVLRLDAFPAGDILLPNAPVRSITSIQYVDTAGDTQTWSSTLWASDLYSEPARIRPAYGEVYPSTREQMNAVTVTYKAGYATQGTAATSDLITATNHVLASGDATELYYSGPEGGAMPAGLAESTTYYARDVTAGTSFKLAATSGGSAIDITGTITGTGAQIYVGVVPRPIRDAMLLMCGDWFKHREDVITGTIVSDLPRGVDTLLSPYRILQF